MFRLVMCARFGVEYVVDHDLSYEEAVGRLNWLLNNTPKYFHHLLVYCIQIIDAHDEVYQTILV